MPDYQRRQHLMEKKKITYESLYTSKNLKSKQDEYVQLEFLFRIMEKR